MARTAGAIRRIHFEHCGSLGAVLAEESIGLRAQVAESARKIAIRDANAPPITTMYRRDSGSTTAIRSATGSWTPQSPDAMPGFVNLADKASKVPAQELEDFNYGRLHYRTTTYKPWIPACTPRWNRRLSVGRSHT
jgi:hypothetical protein